jgi:hypothetical protein
MGLIRRDGKKVKDLILQKLTVQIGSKVYGGILRVYDPLG